MENDHDMKEGKVLYYHSFMEKKYTKMIDNMNTSIYSIMYMNIYYVYRRPRAPQYIEKRLEDNSES